MNLASYRSNGGGSGLNGVSSSIRYVDDETTTSPVHSSTKQQNQCFSSSSGGAGGAAGTGGGVGLGNTPAHANIVSDILSCILLVINNYKSKKFNNYYPEKC